MDKKPNPKENVNVIELVDEFVNTLNSRCKTANIPHVYSVSIIDDTAKVRNRKGDVVDKKCKQLRFTESNLQTHERVVIAAINHIPANPADLITGDYKRRMYKQFLYEATANLLLNQAARVKEDNLKKQMAVATKVNTNTAEPAPNNID